jgi:hypothetical protein
MAEIRFISNCKVCGRKQVMCRNHHLIPKRLLATLPLKQQKKWRYQIVVICDKCNRFIHPENVLYRKIKGLMKELKKNAPPS